MKKKDFKKVYENYKKKVFMLSYSITTNYDDAMDIVQETFIKTYNNFDNIENYTSYILTICKNLSLNFINKHNRIVYNTDSLDIAIENTIEDDIENKRILNHVKNFIKNLSENERIVFSLKFYGSYSYTEIANEMNIKEVTVRTYYKRAIDKIKEHFNV